MELAFKEKVASALKKESFSRQAQVARIRVKYENGTISRREYDEKKAKIKMSYKGNIEAIKLGYSHRTM